MNKLHANPMDKIKNAAARTAIFVTPGQHRENEIRNVRDPYGIGYPAAGDVAGLSLSKTELLKRAQFNIRKLTQLCSFIPDFILTDEVNRKIPYQFSIEAVVLMADISGFTALTEAYSLRGKGGTDQLTKTLAGYIGPMAECILQADGDIVKYAGDAFIAYWRSRPEFFPEDIQRTVDCALYIQEKYGSYLCKDVDITIKVKIGIGAGMTHFSGIGTEAYQHYVAFGPGVQAASEAEKHCSSGDIVLDPSAWAYCSPPNFRYSLKENPFVHIFEIANFINFEKRGRPQQLPSKKGKGGNRESAGMGIAVQLDKIRPHIKTVVERKPESVMRPFVIPPVLLKLDDDIPVEYLNESRIVCICFIQLKTDDKVEADKKTYRENMASIVQRAFVKIYQNVTKLQGALSKVIMFDKGLTYLVVFGLPGYINENQSAHALKFSYRTRLALKTIKYVTEVSIGVTTGPCYCGIIGHPRRQEYTVIGRKVNKAARLMCYYPGKLTCDQDTCYHSKFPMDNFKLMEAKELKGIKDVGKIYEFVNIDTSDDSSIPFFQYPILGRQAELAFFKNAVVRARNDLEHTNKHISRIGHQDVTGSSKPVWMIIFEGDNGIGKSRMLGACIQKAESLKVRVYNVGMTLATSSQPEFAISALVTDALGLVDLRTVQEREDYLRKRVNDAELLADLCLINEILHTRFPLNQKYTTLDVNSCHTYGQHVLSTLLRVTYPENLILFVVDDSHLMDYRSWEYLLYISKSPNVFVLCSLRRSNAGSPKLLDSVSKQIYRNKSIKIIRLIGLDKPLILPLACQIMQVKAIPEDLEKLLSNKSNGVPAWISEVLNDLVRQGIIRFQDASGRYKQKMANADVKYLEIMKQGVKKSTRKRLKHEDLSKSLMEEPSKMKSVQIKAADVVNPLQRVLVIKSGTNIQSVSVSGTLKEIILDAYDELNPNEQIILKAATVLGSRFSRKMLTSILPSYELWARKYDQCFNHLMEMKYFRCAYANAKQKEQASVINAKPQCFCRDEDAEEGETRSVQKRPKYYSCKFMEFFKETMVEVVYDLMTQDQRTEFHLKAGKYLDASIILCESCGGGNRSYLYGFTNKPNDLTVEAEETLNMQNNTRNRLMSRATERRETVRRLSNSSFHAGEKMQRSLVTQLQGIKKTFESRGDKIAHVEMDILKHLIEFDRSDRKKTRFATICCRRGLTEEEIKEEEEEFRKFEGQERQLHPDNTLSGDTKSKETFGFVTDYHTTSRTRHSSTRSNRTIDLRMCQCAILQAKICVEMVWHYREAKKYGRCLHNLLDAAESDVTVGNGTQALVHIEDAKGLMKQLKNGDLPAPEREDIDDCLIDETEAEAHIEFLCGLAYFEIGVNGKAREYFLKALRRLDLNIGMDEAGKVAKRPAILRAKLKLCSVRQCRCRRNKSKMSSDDESDEDTWQKKIRILSYLHSLFKSEKKIEVSLLVAIWQVIIAEQYGHPMHDIIPAYSNIMDSYRAMSKHKKVKHYENLALGLIRSTVGSADQIEPVGLITSASLFYSIGVCRLYRGEVEKSSKASYLALRIAYTVHDNGLTLRALPVLCHGLLLSLRITELAEALQKLWFLAEEIEDWNGVSSYYAICMDLLLNTAYPLENFGVCENFIRNSDWGGQPTVFRDFDTQYSLECSLALWYARHSRWEPAQKWFNEAESHKPKNYSFTAVISDLKLLEFQLITVNHYLESKRYQHFSKARNSAKELMRTLAKATAVLPVLKPRFTHLVAYYYRIRSRNREAEKKLKKAEKAASKMGNFLEQEWITHSRTVWGDMSIPSVKYFWLEHTESHTLDWHSSGMLPWANIMYSLPLPALK